MALSELGLRLAEIIRRDRRLAVDQAKEAYLRKFRRVEKAGGTQN